MGEGKAKEYSDTISLSSHDSPRLWHFAIESLLERSEKYGESAIGLLSCACHSARVPTNLFDHRFRTVVLFGTHD